MGSVGASLALLCLAALSARGAAETPNTCVPGRFFGVKLNVTR